MVDIIILFKFLNTVGYYYILYFKSKSPRLRKGTITQSDVGVDV